MTLSQLIVVLLARWKVIVATIGLGVAIAIAASTLLPARYTATSTVVVDFKGSDPVFGAQQNASAGAGVGVPTQVDIITSKRNVIEAIRLLKLADSPAVQEQYRSATGGQSDIEDWLATLLSKSIEVKPSRDSRVININFDGGDPQFAAAVANAVADAYQRVNLEMRVEPAKQAAAWFDERLKVLRADVEKAQAKLSAYQREKGFTALDERGDIESARLSELSQSLSAAQAQAFAVKSQQRQLQEFLSRGASPESIPDVLGNPVIIGLKQQISAAEARLQTLASQLGANHPDVARTQAELTQQRERLRSELATVAQSINNGARIAERREAELRAAATAQKNQMLRLNQGRDEMATLIKDVESAQRAYDAASQRLTQTSLESQVNQTVISILNRAAPPAFPSFPRKTLNLIVGFLIGAVLGFGLALLLEILDRRVRSEEDLLLGLEAPLVGVLESRRGKGSRRFWFGSKTPALPAPVSSSTAVVPSAA
jgi:chain length determinant protein EpsF